MTLPSNAPGAADLKKMLGKNSPFPDSASTPRDSSIVNAKGGGLGGAAKQALADRQQAEEASQQHESPVPEPHPLEIKPQEDLAVLSNPQWVAADTLFHQEADVSVQVALPKGKEHITRVEAELFAKTPSGPESIWKGEGHAQADGTATITLPVYRPMGHKGDPVEYFLIFKHKLAKQLKPESLLRKVSETALRSADHQLVPGISFAKDTSFIRPKAADGLKQLESRFKDWETKYPKGKIVIYGHANPDENEPKALSERRAESVFAFINNDPDTWEHFYKTEKWSLIALQQIMIELGHYHGKTDDEYGPSTQAAFRAIQKKSGLPESGKEDAATRKVIFADYMRGKHDIKLDAGRFRKVAGNSWMGCSHFNRAIEGDEPAPENRRVAFVLINESRFFPVNFPCQDRSESACQNQCKKPGKRAVPITSCHFYDELLREERQADTKKDEVDRKSHDVPWMIYADQEAKKWQGKTEDEISKSINYHKMVGINLNDLVGTDHAWCASFVSYCLKQSGFNMPALPCRVRSFLDDENFIKIDKPVFGAIAVVANYHVCFVYADDKKSSNPVVLGGNQSDQINFGVFHEKITYLLPKLFEPSKYKIPELAEKTAAELNSEFGIHAIIKMGDATR